MKLRIYIDRFHKGDLFHVGAYGRGEFQIENHNAGILLSDTNTSMF